MTAIDDTLAERGARYGDFTEHARVAQALQNALRVPIGWHACNDVQKQALTVICDKMARIVTGDPNYADNWHDIQGYAKLVEERLPTLISPDIKPPYNVVKPDGWIDWRGGECPVAPDTHVERYYRDGTYGSVCKAWIWNWRHIQSDGDIVAYRIVKD